jgi:hypothetical protein
MNSLSSLLFLLRYPPAVREALLELERELRDGDVTQQVVPPNEERRERERGGGGVEPWGPDSFYFQAISEKCWFAFFLSSFLHFFFFFFSFFLFPFFSLTGV